MHWTVLLHPEFRAWLYEQEEGAQDVIFVSLGLLQREGPMLPRPYADTVKGSRYPNMKELRVQYRGDPWRLLFAFDPKRQAIILVGGNKTGHKRWYEQNIPIADERFAEHLKALEENER